MGTERCWEGQNWCQAILTQWTTGNDTQRSVVKGCAWMEGTNQTTSYSSKQTRSMQSEYYCSADLCNREDPAGALGADVPNGFQCHTCSSLVTCNETENSIQNCTGLEKQCVFSSQKLMFPDRMSMMKSVSKGCWHNPGSAGAVGYITAHSSLLISFCNSSLCNNATMGFQHQNRSVNGVTCFTCEGNRTTSCSHQNEALIECYGPLTQCMEAMSVDEQNNVTSIIKGCATPAWCQHPLLTGFQKEDFHSFQCCEGRLCNTGMANITEPDALSTTASTSSMPRSSNVRGNGAENGGASVYGSLQFLVALLLISTSWNLMMATGF
ncbi:urokinase plasminogen activator surface receptor-like isoform X2 [Ambystoma mexicanum]